MSIIFLERTFCCKVKTEEVLDLSPLRFLERTFCCKVKTRKG